MAKQDETKKQQAEPKQQADLEVKEEQAGDVKGGGVRWNVVKAARSKLQLAKIKF